MLDKTQRINELMDWYGSLLTEKQLEIARFYYQEDLSLSEIAEHTHSSRAAIHESLKRTEELLEGYESKLNCLKSYKDRLKMFQSILECGHEDVNRLIQTWLDQE